MLARTSNIAARAVNRLREAFSGTASSKPTLGGALSRVRNELKKSGDIKARDDLRIRLRNELDDTIELMDLSIPVPLTVA